MDVDHELTTLEGELKRLEAEYNMFFAGRLPRPPWETRGRVDAMVKRLDRTHTSITGERFRFNTIQTRFQTFVDLWERGLRAREEGRPGPFALPQRAAEPEKPQRPEDRILHVTTFSDPLKQMDKLHDLYDSVAEARRQAGEEPVPFPQYFAAGMIAAGIMATSFTTLAVSIANEQHKGTLKRLGGTPLPRAAYFAGYRGVLGLGYLELLAV